MKHTFTRRELILILICAVLALGIFYYEFAYKNIMADIDAHNTDNLTDELTITEAKAVRYQKMKTAIAEGKTNTGEIAVYNNLANEVAEVGNILNGNAEDISIQWNEPVWDNPLVRRQADISFETGSYDSAKSLIQSMINCRYRNVVTDLDISSDNDEALGETDEVTVSLTITFFETTDNASTTQGLTDTSTSDS